MYAKWICRCFKIASDYVKHFRSLALLPVFSLSSLASFCILIMSVWTNFWQNLSWAILESCFQSTFFWTCVQSSYCMTWINAVQADLLGLMCWESSFIVIMQLITALSDRIEFSTSFLFLNTFSWHVLGKVWINRERLHVDTGHSVWWISGHLNVAVSCLFLWLIFWGLMIILHQNESWPLDQERENHGLDFVEYDPSVHILRGNYFVTNGKFSEEKSR